MQSDSVNGRFQQFPSFHLDKLQASQDARDAAIGEFMNPERPTANVVGIMDSVKIRHGESTGTQSLTVLVEQKLPKGYLRPSDRIPAKFNDMPTDVLAVGRPIAQQQTLSRQLQQLPTAGRLQRDGYEAATNGHAPAMPGLAPYPPSLAPEPFEVGSQALTARCRPAKGGFSVGHFNITAGTLATCAYDLGALNPTRFYILSNNHVLADSNAGSPGDPILQPGPFDGGALPNDQIAILSNFVPIRFSPPIAPTFHNNLVDAAIAEASFQSIDREIHWLDSPRGWRRRASAIPGEFVKKVGRTTNLQFGQIMGVNATVDVNYGGGRVARFVDQIITTNISAGGDSGSLVLTRDNLAIGLLFAGSAQITVVNHFEHVRTLLQVEIAELEL
jgi:hypothetical protein